MSGITYGVVEERYSIGTKIRISYGITAFDITEKDDTSTIVASVHDITDDKESLTEMVKRCNTLKLSLVHLYEVVEDFLSV